MTNDHDRRDAGEALRQSEELFRTVFERAPDDAIVVTDAARRVLARNPAAERVCGWSASEAMEGLSDVIFLPEEREAGVPEQ